MTTGEYSERLDEEMSSPVTTLQSCKRPRENASLFASQATETVIVPCPVALSLVTSLLLLVPFVEYCTFLLLLGFLLSATR
jgi:hypothetical protein